jgi:hypothetical protein
VIADIHPGEARATALQSIYLLNGLIAVLGLAVALTFPAALSSLDNGP